MLLPEAKDLNTLWELYSSICLGCLNKVWKQWEIDENMYRKLLMDQEIRNLLHMIDDNRVMIDKQVRL